MVFAALVTFVKDGMFPLPLAGFTLPMGLGITACQEKVTFGVVELKVTKAELVPLQMDWFAGEKVTTGAGLTVITT